MRRQISLTLHRNEFLHREEKNYPKNTRGGQRNPFQFMNYLFYICLECSNSDLIAFTFLSANERSKRKKKKSKDFFRGNDHMKPLNKKKSDSIQSNRTYARTRRCHVHWMDCVRREKNKYKCISLAGAHQYHSNIKR